MYVVLCLLWVSVLGILFMLCLSVVCYVHVVCCVVCIVCMCVCVILHRSVLGFVCVPIYALFCSEILVSYDYHHKLPQIRLLKTTEIKETETYNVERTALQQIVSGNGTE